jgi:hypothetical protein
VSSRSDVSAPDVQIPDVQILVWPQDAGRLETLRAVGSPCLVLVPPSEPAPGLDGDLEDWVRLPADAQELELRRRRLARLAREDSPTCAPTRRAP